MSYTVLRVTEAGVVLYEEHERRLSSAHPEARAQCRQFARTAAPGVYSLRWEGDFLWTARRVSSVLFDGMPVEWAVSPIAGKEGQSPKIHPPDVYSPLRKAGVATLLTSANGAEIYESCSAAVVAWEENTLVFPPMDRPRVASASEAALTLRLKLAHQPILRNTTTPLALVNAVKGACLIDCPGREPFPKEAIEQIDEAFRSATSRE